MPVTKLAVFRCRVCSISDESDAADTKRLLNQMAATFAFTSHTHDASAKNSKVQQGTARNSKEQQGTARYSKVQQVRCVSISSEQNL